MLGATFQGRGCATALAGHTSYAGTVVATGWAGGAPAPRTSTGDAQLRSPRATNTGVSCAAERKQLTILFADISGSTTLSRSVELDEWWTVLTDVYELMCAAVCRFGGWVGNFTGDGVQGVFESPGRAGEHARRACEAALFLRDTLRSSAEDLDRHHGLELDVRIGINSGEAVTGTIGGGDSRHRTACGFPVALAKRMETLARPGGIYLSEHTAALLADELEVCDLGAFALKGVA